MLFFFNGSAIKQGGGGGAAIKEKRLPFNSRGGGKGLNGTAIKKDLLLFSYPPDWIFSKVFPSIVPLSICPPGRSNQELKF